MEKEKNIILIEFDQPQNISVINFYNYTKDSSRAVKEAEIFLDNNLVYSGNLNDPDDFPLSSIIFG